METMWSIGDISAQSGVPASTLRYWEDIGLLPTPVRVGGRRRYSASILRRLKVIGLCKAAGFELDEVQRLLTDASPGRPASRALAADKLSQIDAQMAVLAQARAIVELGMTCSCPSIDQCTCEVHAETTIAVRDRRAQGECKQTDIYRGDGALGNC
jgi:MerR family redox-sensitive transcriptional activator SoxR